MTDQTEKNAQNTDQTESTIDKKLEAQKMTEKTIEMGNIENGKTKIVEWQNICDNENSIAHDFFKTDDEKLTADYIGFDNVIVEFKHGFAWAGIEKFGFSLHRKFKTIGTYCTRLNKIANGVNPESRESYACKTGTRSQFNYGVKKINADTIEIFSLNDFSQNVTIEFSENGIFKNLKMTGDFENLNYYATGVIEKNKWLNRIESLLEFDNDIPCESPKHILSHSGHSVELNENYTDADLKNAQKNLMGILFENDVYVNGADIAKLKPEKIGGGTIWFNEWLIAHDLIKKNRSIEK